ncbi:MAG: FIST C-terminal domain-containing protein [Gammaproteobacteria bacterium]
MDTFRLAHATGDDWQTITQDCIQQLDDCSDANLAFVYITDALASELGDILRYLKEHTGIPHWIGSIGQAICCTNHEYYEQPAIVLMAAQFPEDSFTIFHHAEDTQHLKTEDNDAFTGVRFALIHGDPRNGQLTELIEKLPEQLGNGYLAGGLTSSASHMYQIADSITEGQISGVVFNDDVPVLTGLSQGCSPIGPTHNLTDCDAHMAITIDNKPALDVFKQDIGEVLARDIDRAAGYIFAGFPVKGSDTGDYLVRTIVGLNEDQGMLAIGENMKPGTQILFCRRDGQSAVEDMQRMLENIKQRLGNQKVKGALYISCLGRGQGLFGENSRELKMISEVLGDISLVGFYANGEIAGNQLYGYTGVLTLFV